MQTYEGSCHCGAITYRLKSDLITTGVRCNCSICHRRNSVMSSVYYEPDLFELVTGEDNLTLYQWGDHDVNHYFCKTCGIYTFHDGDDAPGRYRVNLGCLQGINLETLVIRVFDGHDTWKYFDE